MEDQLRKLPLRSLPTDYTDRVMARIAQVEARTTDRWIAAQIAITGVIALGIAWIQSADIFALLDSALETCNAAMVALDQFGSENMNALANFQFEPLENTLAPNASAGVASFEWMTLGLGVGIVWLFANGVLIVNLRKEKLA